MMAPKAILAKALAVIPIPALEMTQTLQRQIPAMTILLTKLEIPPLLIILAKLIQKATLEPEVMISKTLKLILMIPEPLTRMKVVVRA